MRSRASPVRRSQQGWRRGGRRSRFLVLRICFGRWVLLLDVSLHFRVDGRLVGVRGKEAPLAAEARALHCYSLTKPYRLVTPFSHRSPSRQEPLDPAAVLLRPKLGAITIIPLGRGMASVRQRAADERLLDGIASPMCALDVATLAIPKGGGHHPAPRRKALQHAPMRYKPAISASQKRMAATAPAANLSITSAVQLCIGPTWLDDLDVACRVAGRDRSRATSRRTPASSPWSHALLLFGRHVSGAGHARDGARSF